MKIVGAIDIGSNAIRMSCARLTADRRIEILSSIRTPMRLGGDVFTDGAISEATKTRLIETLKLYKRDLVQNGCTEIRAYATSAFRETSNQQELIDLIQQEAGIELNVIAGGKEASLIRLAVCNKIDLEQGASMLADLGGGSLEISVLVDGEFQFAETFRLGTVRLLRMMKHHPDQESDFITLVKTYLKEATRGLNQQLHKYKFQQLVITGGNAVAIGKLAERFTAARSSGDQITITKDELKLVRKELTSRTYAKRIEELGLAEDRADVIIPAVLVFQAVLKMSGCFSMIIPDVGLREGILQELLDEYGPQKFTSDHKHIIRSAYYYVRKYNASINHARTVQKLAIQIFDGLQELHKLGHRERVFLEVAAVLHDIGRFIRPSAHHKHSMYLIQHAELVGLTNEELNIVALMARYHNKGTPSEKNVEYKQLSVADRLCVDYLTAILRVADALDREHNDQVRSVSVHIENDCIRLTLECSGDLLLVRWSVDSKKSLFETIFSKSLTMDRHEDVISEVTHV